jgi:hydrogenase-4 component E
VTLTSSHADLLLLAVVILDLYIVATSRIGACVNAAALQGAALAALPLALGSAGSSGLVIHTLLVCVGTLAIKAFVVPRLLFRAIRVAKVRREVEPFVSLHASVVIGAALVGVSFWLASVLVLPRTPPSTLIVPIAFSTLLLGFLVLVSRRKAVTQVVGYLLIENGVFIFGQALAREIPFVVELGILLDLLVGIFVFGIAIHHISREFDHIDTAELATLKD